jgi:hypothetical protein
MKKLCLLLLLSMFSGFLPAQQPVCSEVKILNASGSLNVFARMGLPVEEGFHAKDGSWTILLPAESVSRVRQAGFTVEVLHPDYSSFIETRNRALTGVIENINQHRQPAHAPEGAKGYAVPQHFKLGSMGGFYYLEEVLSELDSMRLLYPGLISVKTAAGSSNSIEGRPIWYVKISDNPGNTEAEPAVFYNALIHAREPMGMQQLMFFMWYLLENYETSEEVRYLVDNLELYFMPVANPDGYAFNHAGFPIGGGSWRKNRRNNGGGEYGVDLNRNFGFKWGWDDLGSSPNPGDLTYRGTGPFSEPETQIIRDFSIEKNFRIIMNYHTYSNLLLYPWSWETALTPDSTLELIYADYFTRENGYTSGTPGSVLYNTNGDAMDWAYGEQTLKPKSISFTAEIGNQNDGFWPLPSRIIPLALENMYANFMVAHLALRYAEVSTLSPPIVDQKEGFIKFGFTRFGMDEPAGYTVSIEPLDPELLIAAGPSRVFANPVRFQEYTDSIAYTLAPDIAIGTPFRFVYNISNGMFVFRDTITRYFGPPVVVFSDSCHTMEQWTSSKWNVSHTQYFSPDGSLTDSPGGNYPANGNWPVTMREYISLDNSPVAVISFMARWNIEKGYDFVQFEVSDDNGFNWYPLEGRYTTPGTLNQAPGEPVYDGRKLSWLKEEIMLTNYGGKDVKFRFVLKTDAGSSADGFYFDDFNITLIDMTGVGAASEQAMPGWLSEPVPNPAAGLVNLHYHFGEALPRMFILSDSRGALLKQIPVTEHKGSVSIAAGELPPGVYFCRITGPASATSVKKLVVIR